MSEGLLPHLQVLATVARRQTHRIASAVYHSNGDVVDRDEFKSYSESAAFLAYIALGGSPDSPDDFDWQGRRTELLRETQRELRKMLKGADQGFDDARLRSRVRPDRACVQEFRWQSWGEAGVDEPLSYDPRTRRAKTVVATTESCDAPMISAELDDQLHELGKLVAESLSKEELDLVTEHYFNGRSQHDIARALAQASPRYAEDPQGLSKAYNATMVKTHRARKKLRDALGDQWLTVKRELEEVA